MKTLRLVGWAQHLQKQTEATGQRRRAPYMEQAGASWGETFNGSAAGKTPRGSLTWVLVMLPVLLMLLGLEPWLRTRLILSPCHEALLLSTSFHMWKLRLRG